MRTAVILVAGALVLSSCSHPLVEPSAPTFQKKVTHAKHWQLLANATATQVTGTVNGTARVQQAAVGGPAGSRIYIHAPATDMPFAISFKRMLQQSLIESGFTVARHPGDSIVVNFAVETYAYGPKLKKTPFGYASLYTTLAALGWTLSEVGVSTGGGIAILALAGPILDFLTAMGDITNAEVLLTTSIVDRDTILFQTTDAFYVEPTDLPLYWSMFPAASPLETGTSEQATLPMHLVTVSAH